VAQALADLLRAGREPRLINISSDMASLGDGPLGGGYAYRASKAALNMITVTLARDLGPDGIVTVAIHPGWVQTDMGGPGAALPVDEAARAVLAVIDDLTPEDNGCFYDWNGSGRGW
jgi:NAD(P)-dependent dehydrogenase (short-subunit alcohol dehydrogenase family)